MSLKTFFTAAEDAAIRAAQNGPELVTGLAAVNPALAARVAGETTAASHSPIGAVLLAGVAWLSARYGFGWSDAVDSVVAGAGVLIGGYLWSAVAARLAKPPAVAIEPVSLGVATIRGAGSVLALALLLSACSAAQVQRAAVKGQLFCRIESAYGPLVVGIVNAEVPGAVIATGATKAFVDGACAAAGGVPVSPPESAVPNVAVTTP